MAFNPDDDDRSATFTRLAKEAAYNMCAIQQAMSEQDKEYIKILLMWDEVDWASDDKD